LFWFRLKLADDLTSTQWIGCATNCFTPSIGITPLNQPFTV
jgi:hypothetical protein